MPAASAEGSELDDNARRHADTDAAIIVISWLRYILVLAENELYRKLADLVPPLRKLRSGQIS